MQSMEFLDIAPLKNAVNALKAAIGNYNEYSPRGGTLKDTLRSGVIQNFEVAYELSWKFMKRWLSFNVSLGFAKNFVSYAEEFTAKLEAKL